jgi:signal transduction histidine kinase
MKPLPLTSDGASAEPRIFHHAKRIDHQYEMSKTAAATSSSPSGDRRYGAVAGDVAGLVHQIRNPLFAILGHVELALRDAEPGSPTEEHMRIIQRTGLEIKDILRGLLHDSQEATTGAQPRRS